MERITRQRDSIRDALQTSGRPLSPAEILAIAQQAVPSLGLATVYRNLKQLVEAGETQVVELPGEPPRYEVASHHHHHHFHCTVCDRVYDVHDCPGDMKKLAPAGFTVERHEVILYGRCEACRKQTTSRRSRA